MAKAKTLEHPKTLALADALGIMDCFALGILEAFWHHVTAYYPDGEITDMKPRVMARSIRYTGDADELVAAFVEAGLIDQDGERLLVHDWPDHCNDAVHLSLARAHTRFANGATPRMTRMSKDERERLTEWFNAHPVRTQSAQEAHTVRTESALPSQAKPSLTKPSQAKPSNNPLTGVEGVDEPASETLPETADPPWFKGDDSPGGALAREIASTKIAGGKTPYAEGERLEYLTRQRCDDLARRIQSLDPGGDEVEHLTQAWHEHHDGKRTPPYKDAVRALGDWVSRREADWKRLAKARGGGNPRDDVAETLRILDEREAQGVSGF